MVKIFLFNFKFNFLNQSLLIDKLGQIFERIKSLPKNIRT
jgi:hypothetical protein